MRMIHRVSAMILALAIGASGALAQSSEEHGAHHPNAAGAAQAPAPTQPRGMKMGDGMAPGGSRHRPGMMGGDMSRMMQMMQMMQTMHGAMSRNCMAGGRLAGMSPFAHIEGRIAFYKAELGITDAQQPQWDALVEVVRTTAKTLQQAYMPAMQANAPVSALELIDRRIALVSALAEVMKATRPPFQALYAALSDEQKKKADELMAEHLQAMQASGL